MCTKIDELIAVELASVSGYILHSNLLNDTFFNSFDRAYSLAKKFIIKFPIDTNWKTNNLEYDEEIEKFVKNELK